MANEVKLIISADGSRAIAVTKEVGSAYKTLNTSTVADINAQKGNVTAAYDTIKASGLASAAEIRQAELAKNKEIARLNQELLGNQTGIISQIKSHWLALSAGIASAMVAVNKGKEFTEIGAKALQVEEAFGHAARSMDFSADAIVAAMKRATAGTIDDSDLMQKALKGVTQDIDPAGMVQIGEMARTAARRQGVDVKDAYESIADSIANDIPRAMRRFGLITREEMGLLNKATQLGIDDVNLLQMAYRNAQIASAEMGVQTDSVSEVLQRHRAHISQTREEIGKLIVTIVGGGIGAIRDFAAAMDTAEGRGRITRPAGTYGVTPYGRRQDDSDARKAMEGVGYEPGITEDDKKAYAAYLTTQREEENAALKARIDAEKSKGKIEQLAETYKNWLVQIENLNPALTEQAKKMNEIDRQAQKLIESGMDKGKVNSVVATANAYIEDSARIEMYEKEQKLRRDSEEAWRKTQESVTEKQASEINKRLVLEDKWVEEMRRQAMKYVKTEEEAEEELSRFRKIAAANKARILQENDRNVLESETRRRLASLDIMEKDRTVPKAAIYSEKIAAEQRLLDTYRSSLQAAMDSGNDIAKITLLDKIANTEKQIMDLQLSLKEQTGSFGDGLSRGLRDYVYEMRSTFQTAEELSKGMAQSIEKNLEDYLYSPSEYKIESLNNAFRRLFAKAGAELIVGQAKDTLYSLLGMKSPAQPTTARDAEAFLATKENTEALRNLTTALVGSSDRSITDQSTEGLSGSIKDLSDSLKPGSTGNGDRDWGRFDAAGNYGTWPSGEEGSSSWFSSWFGGGGSGGGWLSSLMGIGSGLSSLGGNDAGNNPLASVQQLHKLYKNGKSLYNLYNQMFGPSSKVGPEFYSEYNYGTWPTSEGATGWEGTFNNPANYGEWAAGVPTGYEAAFSDPANYGTWETGMGGTDGGGMWSWLSSLFGGGGGGEGFLGGLGGGAGITGGSVLAGVLGREYLGDKGAGILSGSIHDDWSGLGDTFGSATSGNFEDISRLGWWSQFGFPLGYFSGTNGWDPFGDVWDWFHFDAGGIYEAGMPMIVGENRPELMIPNTGGRVIPNLDKLGATPSVHVVFEDHSGALKDVEMTQDEPRWDSEAEKMVVKFVLKNSGRGGKLSKRLQTRRGY